MKKKFTPSAKGSRVRKPLLYQQNRYLELYRHKRLKAYKAEVLSYLFYFPIIIGSFYVVLISL